MAGIGDLVARTAAQSGGSWLTPEQVQFLRGLQLKAQDPETTYRALSDDEWQMEYDPNSGEMVRRPPSGAVDQGANSVSGQSDWMMPVKGTSPSYNLNSLDQDALSAAGFQSKYNQVERLPDGTLKVTLQRPGMHKYDTMEAYYKVDPATGQTTLVGGAPSRQTSSGQELRDAVEEGAGHIGGAVLAGTGIMNPGFFGTGALGAAGAGAATSGGITGALGGGWDDTLKAAAIGGLAGGGLEYLRNGELGSLQFGNLGAPTSAPVDPMSDFLRTGTTDYGAGSIHAHGLPPMSTQMEAPSIANFDSSSLPTSLSGDSYLTNPQMMAPNAPYLNYLNPGFVPPSLDVVPTDIPTVPSFLDKATGWVADNPLQAAQIGLIGAGAIAGGAGGNAIGGVGGGGDQSGLTAKQAPAFQRQQIAAPAGYRAGFDPEHKFFTGIGSVGIGQIPQTPSGSSTG